MFDPDVYPLNPACLDGRISEEFQAHEHPLEPEAGQRRAEQIDVLDGGKEI
jgi:hypothetical protein